MKQNFCKSIYLLSILFSHFQYYIDNVCVYVCAKPIGSNSGPQLYKLNSHQKKCAKVFHTHTVHLYFLCFIKIVFFFSHLYFSFIVLSFHILGVLISPISIMCSVHFVRVFMCALSLFFFLIMKLVAMDL